MADFCKQCSEEIFGFDTRDLVSTSNDEPLGPNEGYIAICEGCGYTLVDADGRCISPACETHGKEAK